MARTSRRLADIHTQALTRFDESYRATKEDRERAKLCRRFVNIRGAQWDWDEEHDFENKIKLEIDHVSGAILRIKNEYRKNRISAKFLPKDGSDADALSDALAGRFRADTLDAGGIEARTMAFDSALEGGFGGMRLRADYDDDDPDDTEEKYQRICLEAVNDAESCLFFDVNAKRKDKTDGQFGFLITPWSREAFIEEYGEDCASWPEALNKRYTFDWFTPDFVFVCEYFVKETQTIEWFRYRGGPDGNDIVEYTEDELSSELKSELKATGYRRIKSRMEQAGKVVKYVLNGAKVLHDRQAIAGRYIPLIPQYGQRTVIDHVERFRGHVAKAMDAQIVYNLQVSKIAETAAVSGIEKPIFLAEQIAPFQDKWNDSHKNNDAFLTIASIEAADGSINPTGPVGKLSPPEIAPGVAALVTITRQDVADQMGNPENAEQLQPDTSGIAMDLVQGRIDMQSYGYMDEAKDAERLLATIYQSMAADIYVEEGRKLKVLNEDNARGQVEIGKKVFNPKTGKIDQEVDFSRARFDVEATVGPTSASRRSAIVRTVASLIGQATDPETAAVLTHVGLMNLEAEGMEDVRDWSRKKLLGMGVVKPTKEEQAEIDASAAAQQPAPPDPNAILAQAMAEESQAKAAKAVADTALAEAKTQETQAKTAETLAGIPIAQQKAAIEGAQAIMDQIQDEQQIQPPAQE